MTWTGIEIALPLGVSAWGSAEVLGSGMEDDTAGQAKFKMRKQKDLLWAAISAPFQCYLWPPIRQIIGEKNETSKLPISPSLTYPGP
jgi:hypothetical protein